MDNIFVTLKQAPFGLHQEYTFYQDFQIADRVGGIEGVMDTFNRVQHWQDDPRAWGEVTCALNWRLWDLAETNVEIARLYEKLWTEAQKTGWKHGNKSKEYAQVYFEVTD